MNILKEEYVEQQLCIDYTQKSKNTGFIQIFVAFIFFQSFHYSITNHTLFDLSLSLIVLALICRLIVIKKYSKDLSNQKILLRSNDLTTVAAGLGWCFSGILIVLTEQNLSENILLMFIVLIALSLGSMISLAYRKKVHFIFNVSVLAPFIFFVIQDYQKNQTSSILWLIAYVTITIIYSTKQARETFRDSKNRFSYEYDLKKSLEEIAVSKKTLEEETMKTFHASRLSSLGEMAGGVAHEINNPLTIIHSLSKSVLMNEKEAISDQVKSKLEKIVSSSERIAKIVRGMKLISSKNDGIEHSMVEISQIIDLSVTLFEERIKNENVQLVIENSKNPNVFCNSLQVSQILINLVGNAMDAMESLITENKKKVSIVVSEAGEMATIRVINDGPLIPQHILDKIFEPFYSTKGMGKGTGLGLSISQSLARNNHGQLSYDPYNGQVCFKLTLRLKNPDL